MGRIIVLLVLFCSLGGFAYWKMQEGAAPKDTYSNNVETMFALADADQIERVFMADRRGHQVLLERVEGLNWKFTNKVTGKTYRANPAAIQSLLQTLKKIRTKEPVNKEAMDNAVKQLAAKQTKVEIYGADKKKLRVFYVGPMTSGATGNFMIMEGSDQPYIVYIPNFQGTIGTRFTTDEIDLRDKAFVRTTPEALEFVQVDYQDPSQSSASFRINRLDNGQFGIEPLDENAPKFSQDQVNQDNAETYIEDFDVIASEMILHKDKFKNLRDSLITTQPFAIVTYKATYHNDPQRFRLYSVFNPNADRGDGQVGHRQKIQRYYVDIDEDNFFLAQHLVIRSMLWGYSFFFQQEAVQLLEDEVSTKKSFPDDKEGERARKIEAAKRRATTLNDPNK